MVRCFADDVRISVDVVDVGFEGECTSEQAMQNQMRRATHAQSFPSVPYAGLPTTHVLYSQAVVNTLGVVDNEPDPDLLTAGADKITYRPPIKRRGVRTYGLAQEVKPTL